MSASLFYYKGFEMKDASIRPNLVRWFQALEERPTYRGTQSDYHTHCHDLPPQMGGCFASDTAVQRQCASLVDHGPWQSVPDTSLPEPPTATVEALQRVCKHKDVLVQTNPCGGTAVVDEALRCAMTRLANGDAVTPPPGSDAALRYLRDRVNVPRDMSLWAARRLREALEETAAMAGSGVGPPIPKDHRRDQDPRRFRLPPPPGDRQPSACGDRWRAQRA